MTIAINSQTRVGYIAEVTPGTTPATPAFKVFRSTGESLKAEQPLLFSSELDGRRGQKNFARGTKQGSGSVDVEFSDGTLEDLLESALRSTWATDVLTDQNITKSFTFETTFEQGGTDTFKRLVGAEVSTFALSIRAGEIVTGSVGFVARSGDFSQTAIAGATYVAANSEPILTGAAVDTFTMAGLTFGIVPSIDFTIDNGLSARTGVGAATVQEWAAGTLQATGSVSALLDAAQYAALRAHLDGTSTSLTLEIGDVTLKKMRFEFPVVVIEDIDVASESKEGDVIAVIKWRALQSTSLSGSVVQVTRNLA